MSDNADTTQTTVSSEAPTADIPAPAQAPVDNAHVAPGATQLTEAEAAANAPAMDQIDEKNTYRTSLATSLSRAGHGTIQELEKLDLPTLVKMVDDTTVDLINKRVEKDVALEEVKASEAALKLENAKLVDDNAAKHKVTLTMLETLEKVGALVLPGPKNNWTDYPVGPNNGDQFIKDVDDEISRRLVSAGITQEQAADATLAFTAMKARHEALKNAPAPTFAQAPVASGRTVQALYTLARYSKELEGLVCRYTGHDRTVLNATLDKVTGRTGGALGLHHEREAFIAAGPTNDAAQAFADRI